MNFWIWALLWIGSAASVVYLLAYPLLASGWKSEARWHVMTFSAAVALLFLYLLLGRYGVTRQWGPVTQAWIAIGILGLLVFAVLWRLWILAREQLLRR